MKPLLAILSLFVLCCAKHETPLTQTQKDSIDSARVWPSPIRQMPMIYAPHPPDSLLHGPDTSK